MTGQVGRIRRLALAALASLAVAPMALAQQGDGETIYRSGGSNPQALACITCHGPDAMGMAAGGFPRLAGLPESYLTRRLQDFRQGEHDNPIMKPLASALTEEESEAVSHYLASLPAPKPPRIARDRVPEGTGERLALNGAWERSVPECVACHGPGGIGVGEAFPPLAGQHQSYLTAQLRAWRDGVRRNDPMDLMGHIARALSDEEIEAVAAYFAGLDTEEQQ